MVPVQAPVEQALLKSANRKSGCVCPFAAQRMATAHALVTLQLHFGYISNLVVSRHQVLEDSTYDCQEKYRNRLHENESASSLPG
jgi:hypothetical protein